MAARTAAIRTPDQRLRVFVSSTLKELEPERRAARAAIERLGLAPVMFELGARPHPPRDLYRSYLAQSDIFVGLYAERYGWIAPDEEISGLEDEYRLSVGMPSLIYVREPAPNRDERLETLLDRIRTDDRVSYTGFGDVDELGRLVENDLAILLAERFDRASAPAAAMRAAPAIPAPYTPLVGRDEERAGIRALLDDPATRIVTLTGPGGIGKSRLAIEIAREVAATGRDVAFALLESVTSPDLVIDALARALGVRDAVAEGTLTDRVIAAVGDRDVLLVIDNMEHLLHAVPLLIGLVTGTPRLQLLVTSRSPLRVRPEHVFEIGPLPLPAAGSGAEAAARAASVALFVQRAAAVRPGFALTPANADAVAEICRALDGVPLAIELAAARVRTLDPAELLSRLDPALTLLTGPRDLPERQRTLRATIAWSVDLLDEQERRALAVLATFRGGFTLDSAERVLADSGIPAPLDALEALIDASLVGHRSDATPPTYRLLTTVRAYAHGLADTQARERATRAWISRYRDVVRSAAPLLRGPEQLAQLDDLELESENIAAVGRALLDRGELDEAADYLWSLYLAVWIGGYLGIVQGWMADLLATSDRDGAILAPRTRAIALYYANAIRFWQDAGYDPTDALTESRDLFAESGDAAGAALAGVSIGLALLARPGGTEASAAIAELEASLAAFRGERDAWGQAMALVMLGRIALAGGDVDAARERFEQSLALATAQGERLGIVIALNHRGWARLFLGDADGARTDFGEALDLSLALQHDEGIAYGLEAFGGMRAVTGDARGAGLLLGAARALRVRRGLFNPGAFEFAAVPVGALRAAGHGDVLDAATAEGGALTVAEALTHVRG